MFNIEVVRKNNRTGLFSFPAQIAAMAVLLIMVLGSATEAGCPAQTNPNPNPDPTPRPDPHAPGNFRVTALGTCTVSVAWDPVNFTLEDFNYYLSGTNQAPPAVLPRTATSHTFTGLGAGNEYWFFIYARDVSGRTSGQSKLVTRTLPDTSPPTTAPGVSVGEVGSNYASIAWIRRGRRMLVVLRGLGERQSLCPDREKRLGLHHQVPDAGDDQFSHGPGLRFKESAGAVLQSRFDYDPAAQSQRPHPAEHPG